jgi:uncharacterized protein with PIN domain
MLGSLAKKLRMLGVDTIYGRDASDSEIMYLVRAQGRILFSRDARLVDRLGNKAWLVTGSDTREEFLSIIPVLLETGCRFAPMTRCLRCNDTLLPVDPASARAKAPPHVLEKGFELMSCPACGKVYWQGTHAGRMRGEIEWMEEQLEKEPGAGSQ